MEPATGPDIDETELLIRSTSTILSLVNPQVSPSTMGKTGCTGRSRKLDRIALLFVTNKRADVAAVVASMTPSGLEVVAANEEMQSLNVSKNSLLKE